MKEAGEREEKRERERGREGEKKKKGCVVHLVKVSENN